jgi:fused signal recognition particle receptor
VWQRLFKVDLPVSSPFARATATAIPAPAQEADPANNATTLWLPLAAPPERQGWLRKLQSACVKRPSNISGVFTGRIDDALYEVSETALLRLTQASPLNIC